jgi:exopolysaccharide production protein ExoY
MSLVGPRPIVAAEVEKYGECFDCYCRVKPGLTGLWQVSGRSELTYEERVALDCQYVERWSLLKDVVILSKTFSSVVKQDGAF